VTGSGLAANVAGVEILSPLRAIDFENAWYDAANADHFWMDWRFRELTRLFTQCGLSPSADLQVLEVGGGHGVARVQVEGLTRWCVDLTDLNMVSLERCAPSRGRTLYYDVNDRAPALCEHYDAILLLDVLEHIEHTSTFLKSLAWHLKPTGVLIINVPALPRFYSAYDEVLGHHRRYTKTSLRCECVGADLSCATLRYWGVTLLPLLAARALVMRRLSGEPLERPNIARRGMTPPAVIERVLRIAMHAELRICRDAPVGTSLLCAARKRIP
jgi:hypothetical protein